jgi:predicted phage-related endonuclease
VATRFVVRAEEPRRRGTNIARGPSYELRQEGQAVNAPDRKSVDDAQFRASHVGASEVAALFGCSPHLTHFELWHRKKGNIATPAFNVRHDDGLPDNERVLWGIRLESAIIEEAKERYGYVDREQLDRLSNGKGLGGHPDRRVICPERGPGIIEIKTCDWLERKKWGDEPPNHYLVQSQAYQGLDQVDWGDVLVLVGGNKLERFRYTFRPKIYAEIERRVEAFWQSIAANEPPKPDYSRDLETITELTREGTDATVDLTADNLAHEAAAAFLFAQEARKGAQAKEDAAKAELLDKLGTASVGLLNGFTVRAIAVAAVPDRPAQPGEIIKGRKPYRRLSVKELT